MGVIEKCIICGKKPDAKNSHIVPMNLIKKCIGERNNEISFDIDIQNNKILQNKIYIGNAIKHKQTEINLANLKTIDCNPYTLDYILCGDCERELGKIEGKVYSEIILKIKDEKYQNNFIFTQINDFDVLIPNTKKINKTELDIYFYSIILRVLHYKKIQGFQTNVNKKTVKLIANYLKNKICKSSDTLEYPKTGLIIYVTNNSKLFPTLLMTDDFEKLIIPVCNFFIVLDDNGFSSEFGECVNLIADNNFKFIKNSNTLDEELFGLNINSK